jgi:hypothetical protein
MKKPSLSSILDFYFLHFFLKDQILVFSLKDMEFQPERYEELRDSITNWQKGIKPIRFHILRHWVSRVFSTFRSTFSTDTHTQHDEGRKNCVGGRGGGSRRK